jgi:glycine hydroxymethyltransferase
MILCKAEYAKKIDSAVFPGTQGGPLMHIIAAKAVSFGEALQPSFKEYQQRVLENAKILAQTLQEEGLRIVSGGTDNHLMLVDLGVLDKEEVTGKAVEKALDHANLHCNKNMIPFDPKPALVTSGIRLGSPAATSRGMGPAEFVQIGRWIAAIARNPQDTDLIAETKNEVVELASRFPVPA